jgi:signal transduction histidine kinase
MPSTAEWLVRDACEDFGSAETAEEAALSASYWIREALGKPEAPVRVSAIDRAGRLRVITETGGHAVDGRRRSARRREAFDLQAVKFWDLPHASGLALAFIPALSRKEALGVVEVVGSKRDLTEHLELLLAVAALTGGVLRSVRRQAELERLAGALSGVAQVTFELLRADSPEHAARAATRFVGTQLALPVAAWVGSPTNHVMGLVAQRNVHGPQRRLLRRELAEVERGRGSLKRAMAIFGRVVREPVRIIDAESALLLVGGATHATAELLGLVESLLRHALRVDLPADRLDMGLAWTAHEVRQPLLGARATLQALSARDQQDPWSRELLRRTSLELGEAAQMVEGLLRWGAGVAPLSRTPANLLDLVRMSARSACSGVGDEDRILIDGTPDVTVLADVPHLRAAFGNLVRNALSYSPSERPIKISVHGHPLSAVVHVRDEGPGITSGETGMIFDPLVRGSAGRRVSGSGLGLYITRRVVEAHNGTIGVRSSHRGTTFSVTLPAVMADDARGSFEARI